MPIVRTVPEFNFCGLDCNKGRPFLSCSRSQEDLHILKLLDVTEEGEYARILEEAVALQATHAMLLHTSYSTVQGIIKNLRVMFLDIPI